MKPSISYPDFEKLDIRIGTIVGATEPDWSRKLLRFEVDFGAEIGQRIIFSGIKNWYTPAEFIGKQFAFLINLEPKKMGSEESQGMMIMADGTDKPVLMGLAEQVESGTVVR